MFANSKVKLSCKGWDYNSPKPIYNLVTVLRVIAMGTEQKKVADSMEHHLDRWKDKEDFKDKYKVVVDYALDTLKVDMTEDKILQIITNSYTNDFSHTFPSGNQVRIIFAY
jgi:predicted transcriptional regulator